MMTFIKNNLAFLLCLLIIGYLLFKDGCNKSSKEEGLIKNPCTDFEYASTTCFCSALVEKKR